MRSGDVIVLSEWKLDSVGFSRCAPRAFIPPHRAVGCQRPNKRRRVLATASHGLILILSAPVWIITSTVAAADASRVPRIMSTSPTALNVFARFPQGLPPGINRATMRPKRPTFR